MFTVKRYKLNINLDIQVYIKQSETLIFISAIFTSSLHLVN